MTDRRPTATLIGEAPGPRNGRRVPLDGPSGRSGLAVVAPYPSGTSRWWNDPVNRESARVNFTAIVARCAELGAR